MAKPGQRPGLRCAPSLPGQLLAGAGRAGVSGGPYACPSRGLPSLGRRLLADVPREDRSVSVDESHPQ